MKTLAELIAHLPQVGRVVWIGLRPEHAAAMQQEQSAMVDPDEGLVGDRYQRSGGSRQVTLMQAEHLSAVASILRGELQGESDRIDPALIRRNVVVQGINLLALKGRQFQIGDATLEFTGLCHPCSRLESALGPGGYNAMRGHGGITARVISGGRLAVGSQVAVLDPVADENAPPA